MDTGVESFSGYFLFGSVVFWFILFGFLSIRDWMRWAASIRTPAYWIGNLFAWGLIIAFMAFVPIDNFLFGLGLVINFLGLVNLVIWKKYL